MATTNCVKLGVRSVDCIEIYVFRFCAASKLFTALPAKGNLKLPGDRKQRVKISVLVSVQEKAFEKSRHFLKCS